MSESLIIKDGNGDIKSLQVDSGSNGYISNHTLVSTVTGTVINKYYPDNGDGGWIWNSELSGTTNICSASNSRKGLIINNNSLDGNCYILLGSNDNATNLYGFESLTNLVDPPAKYSFILESGGTYFADSMTCALAHAMFVPSSSLIPNSGSMIVSVTEIY